MVNYNVTTKTMLLDMDVAADTDAGAAKSITTYLNSVDAAKTIRAVSVAPIGAGKLFVTIVHDA